MVYLSTVEESKESPDQAWGLCGRCRFRKENRNNRGSVFLFCRRSESDERYPKYPRLPVQRCDGYEAGPPDAAGR